MHKLMERGNGQSQRQVGTPPQHCQAPVEVTLPANWDVHKLFPERRDLHEESMDVND